MARLPADGVLKGKSFNPASELIWGACSQKADRAAKPVARRASKRRSQRAALLAPSLSFCVGSRAIPRLIDAERGSVVPANLAAQMPLIGPIEISEFCESFELFQGRPDRFEERIKSSFAITMRYPYQVDPIDFGSRLA